MGTLAGIFGGDRQTSALEDIFSQPTQTGINQAESKNIDDNITQLTALRARSKDPADQARIDKAIASLKKQQGEVGYAKPTTSIGTDFYRGVAAGVAKGPVEVGELAAAVPALMGSQTAKDLRSSLAERAAVIQSQVQPPGFSATAGEFSGELPAQALAFGPVARAAGAVASKVPVLAKIFQPVAGNLATRVAVGAAKAGVEVSPITAIASAANRQDALEGAKQALASGDITQEQYDKMSSMATVEAIKQFAESTLGAAAFGALSPAEKAKAGAGTKVPVGGGPAQTEVVQREAELQAINAKAAADAARREEAKQLKKLAKAQWTLDNPHGTWSDLETEEQAKYISDFKAKQAAAATPKTATPPEQTPPAQAEAEHNLDRAQAAGTPEAVQAAEAKVEESKLVGLDNQGRPVTTQQVAELAPPRPDLDKGDGGLSPTVKNYIQRQGLKNAFKQADLPFDEGLTNVQLQERLDQGIQAKAADAKATTAKAQQDAVQAKLTAEHAKISPETVETDYGSLTEEATPSRGAEGAAVPAVSPPQDVRSQLSAGTSSSSPPTAVAVPSRTFLTGVPHEQPLEQMTIAQLDNMKDLVADGIVEASGPHRQQLVSDLGLLAKETLRREATTSAETPTRPYQHLDPNDLQTHREALEAKIEELSGQVKELKGASRDGAKADLADAKARLADIKTEIGTRKVEAREAKKSGETKQLGVAPEAKPTFDYRKAPSKLGDRDLAAQIEDLHSKLEVLDPRDSHEYQERLGKLLEEQAKRSKGNQGPDGMPPIKPGDGGLKLQSHPAVGAFLGGFSYGLITPQPGQDDEQYLSRAFMYGLGSAGLVMGAKYLGARNKALETPKPSTTIPNLDQFPKVVFSADEIKGPKTSTLAKLREFYRGTVRGTEAIEQMTKSTGGLNLSTQQNPGKLAAYWGRYAAQTEHWLTVGPALVADDGLVTHLSGLSHNDIINKIAQGDKEGLDNLMVALSSAELAGKLGEKRVPMGQLQREYIIRNAPQNLMDAAKAMREYHANLLQTQLDAGLISKEGLAKMVSENYYTPMQRVIERLDEIRQRKPNFKGQPIALEAREGGSQMKVKSPSEVTVEMTGRMLRAAEYGKFLNAFVDHVQSLPSFVRQEIMVPTNRSMNPKAGDLEALATELRKATSLSEADARSMVAYLDSDAIHSNPGIITHYNNGVLQSYKVRPDIFQAIKSMTAPEIDGFWRMLGIPTRLATQGTVLNPMFTFRRGFIETFLGHLGSEYGFRPVLDQIPAWWEAFTRSPRFREMQAAGGTGSVQSMQFQQIAKFGGNNALADSWNLMKEGNPIQAYRTLMEPFTMTARVAEYLAALRHGASTLEAAYAANNLLGNVRMQGYMNGMRVFNHLAMFARPTIAHVDRLLEKSGFHPYRVPEYNKTATGQAFQDAGVSPRIAAAMTFMTKGFVGITLPTVALWYMNRNDDEINEVRKTSAGSHYWFMRNPFVEQGQQGSIIRMPRPQGVGQVFGGSAEATLDRMDANDHDGTMRMLSGLYDEVSLNVLPQIGVVPMGLWANRDYRFGSPIVRGSDAGADPNMQGFTDASLPSRIISDKVSDFAKDSNNDTLRRALSPAGQDYIWNTFLGMMGQDALRAVNDAMLYHRDGFLPAKEELPLVSRVLARYPSMGVNSIQKFYERDQKVQAAAETVNKLVKENPQMLADYYSHNSERLSLVRVHQEVRQKIADLRRAMEDIKNAPPGTYDQKGKEDLNKKFTELIIQHAKIANEIAANIGMP